MAFALELKQEWRRFKDDSPGERFEKHRQRMERQSRWHHVLRGFAGGALIIVGIALLFLPGPGILGIIFGFALLAGMSRKIAGVMDRIEPRVRSGLRRARAWWKHLSTPGRAILVALATAVVALGAVVVWRNWVGPMIM